MNYPLCKLCQQRPADKTGSHIVSWFLIRDMVNKSGIKDRNYDIAFRISPDDLVKTYLGQSLLPEDITRIKGKSLDEGEIDKMKEEKNPATADHFLCSFCEKRIGILEAFISRKIFIPLRRLEVTPTEKVKFKEFPDNEALRLFIYSLCWRSAVTGYCDFQMKANEQEQLRRLLNENLSTEENILLHNSKEHSLEITSLPILIAFLETSTENTNATFFDFCQDPYWAFINDFSFQLFFNEKSPKRNNERIFGLNGMIQKVKSLNYKETQIKINIINDARRIKIYKNLHEFFAKKTLRSLQTKFNLAFKHIFKRDAPFGVKKYFLHEVISCNKHGAERYTMEHIQEATTKILLEYAQV